MSRGEINSIKGIIKDIKTSHFNLGSDNRNFGTTNAGAFGFDPKSAQAAKSGLNQALKDDLRASHYKIGYGPTNMNTTHLDTYRSQNINPANAFANLSADLRKSHFNVDTKLVQNGENNRTIYMTDYTSKPIPEAY